MQNHYKAATIQNKLNTNEYLTNQKPFWSQEPRQIKQKLGQWAVGFGLLP